MRLSDVGNTAAVDGLTVEDDTRVALVGLAPVYGHGLETGLGAVGLACLAVPSPDKLVSMLKTEGTVVAVLPSRDGSALTALKLPGERVKAVHVLTEVSTEAYSDALQGGAVAAFGDDAELAQVIRTVRCAALGLTLLPAHVARALSRPQTGPRPHVQGHERGYLRLLADGGTVAGLARRSGYSEREMYRLLAGVYRRLGATNRTEALLTAERWGLLNEET